MNLLLDQNLSFLVAVKIRDNFPGVKHLSDLGLNNFSDSEIWEYAKAYNYCIVTFDSDFIDISTLKGFPPKIIWIRLGNTSTDNIANQLLKYIDQINEFLLNDEIGFLKIK